MELLSGMINEGEGGINWFPYRMEFLRNLLIKHKPQFIVEVGFNLGYSCKLIIDTLYSIDGYEGIKKFYVFDICDGSNNNVDRNGKIFNNIGGSHNYVKPNFEILKNHYNIDIQLIEGDSLETLGDFMNNLDHQIDFVEIDGFHEGITPKNDIMSTIGKIKSGGVLYMDDYNSQYPAIINAIDSTDWSEFETHVSRDIFYAIKK